MIQIIQYHVIKTNNLQIQMVSELKKQTEKLLKPMKTLQIFFSENN